MFYWELGAGNGGWWGEVKELDVFAGVTVLSPAHLNTVLPLPFRCLWDRAQVPSPLKASVPNTVKVG